MDLQNFNRADFGLYRDLLGKIGAIKSWREKRGSGALADIQKHHLLQLKSS